MDDQETQTLYANIVKLITSVDAELITGTHITDDSPGAGLYYSAETVARLQFALRKAAEGALAVLEDLDESEMARLRGRADIAITGLRKALGVEYRRKDGE